MPSVSSKQAIKKTVRTNTLLLKKIGKAVLSKKIKKLAKAPKPEEIQEPKKVVDPALIKPFVSEVAGDKGLRIMDAIGEGAIDEEIEKRTSFKMAEIRHVLNVMHNHGIVEYSRVKNLQTGWFTYTWSINGDRALSNYLMRKKHEYESLRTAMNSQENATFYECKDGCCKLPFDQALDAQFKCTNCDKKLVYTNNQGDMKDLESKISSLQQILERKV